MLTQIGAKVMLQLTYGLYKEVQDEFGGDGGAGVLQRTGKSSADGACWICVIWGSVREADA